MTGTRRFADAVPLDDRGLNYGDGLFETLRISSHGAPLADRHRARMAAGARRLGIRFDSQRFAAALSGLLEHGPGIGKIILTRGSGGRGYAPPPGSEPRWLVRWFPLPGPCPEALEIGLCQTRVEEGAHLAGLKHLNRLDQVLARAEVERAGWDEGLMLDGHGRPRELTAMNLFARFGNVLWTPDSRAGGVAGVLQAWCLERAAGEGLEVSRQPLALARLRDADEVFAGNAVAGIVPVRKLAVWCWTPGSTARSMQDAFHSLFGLP